MKEGTFTTTQRKATKAEREKVSVWVRKWQREFYLHILHIHLFFHDTPREDDESDTFGAAAWIDTSMAEDYHEATINFYPRFFEDNDDEDQEFMIVHEVAHLIVAPVTELVKRQANGGLVTPQAWRNADERATDHIARIVFYGGNSAETTKPMKPATIKARLRKR